MTTGGSESNLCGGERCSGREQFIARACLDAADDEVIAGVELVRREQPNPAVVALNMLEHCYCVGAVRDGRSSHDFAGRSGGKRLGRCIAGTH